MRQATEGSVGGSVRQLARPRALPDVIHTCLRFLLVTCVSLAGQMARGQALQAERILGWDFQRACDANYDLKPDGWQRRQDRTHPAYVEMRIAARSVETAQIAISAQGTLAKWFNAWESGRWDPNYIAETMPPRLAHLLDQTILDNCVEILMDGGAAEIVSPKFPMESRFSYSLRAAVSTEKLDGHRAWIELQQLDAQERVINVLSTDAIQGTKNWDFYQTGSSEAATSKLKWGRIHIKVEPHSSTVLAGIARFDSINVYRMPRLTLTTPLKYHIAQPGENFEISCAASGIKDPSQSVLFELCDHLGRSLRQTAVSLQPHEKTQRAASPVSDQPPSSLAERSMSEVSDSTVPHYVSARANQSAFDGQAVWNLQIADPGLYRIRVNLGRAGGVAQHREILVGVMPDSNFESAGPFGWSLPEFGVAYRPEDVPNLVRRFGAGWIKIPVWFDSADIATSDELIALAERLQNQGTSVVGRLDQPPQNLRDAFGDSNERLYAVHLFREPTEWEPILEPVLTRIGMKLTWFQLGADDDTSFVGKPELSELIASLRSRMQTYSQELKLALAWNWLDATHDAHSMPWNASQFTNSPQLTAAELRHYLAERPLSTDVWVSIDPLPASRYNLLDRIRDLTERMIAIKEFRVSAAFVSNPFNPDLQMLLADQTVGEMLIPWHTLVTNIGGRDYFGSIELPGGSTNHIFSKDGQAVMLLWSDAPVKEQAYLGDGISGIDIWGNPVAVEEVVSARGTPEQSVQTTAWPILLRGIDMNVVNFRQKFQLATRKLSSAVGSGQAISLLIENTLSQTATGTIVAVGPSLFTGGRAEMQVQLPTNIPLTKNLPIAIRTDASAGEHLLRFDIDLLANKPYHFSIYRSAVLGLGDVELSWESTRRDTNLVELRVDVLNNTEDAVSFDCKLFPPGRTYERFKIESAKPGSSLQEVRVFLPQSDAASEAWLRCEQIGTGRVLNYRIRI